MRSLLLLPAIALCAACGGNNTPPKAAVPGAVQSGETGALEAGAKAIQRTAPVNGFNVYLVGFHPMKDHPQDQMEAHHYCNQVNEDFAQCILFDGNTSQANLNGIEYIISETLFKQLSDDEQKLWHPHNYEVLSGQLVAPSLPAVAEKQLMRQKMNSYGKTWHVWQTDITGAKGDALPLGEPHLAWSFNRDGEILPALLKARDDRMKINTPDVRRNRQDLTPLARPQSGVDMLKGKFDRPTQSIDGVQQGR